MSQERAKSRPGQINCNDFYYSISISFFLFKFEYVRWLFKYLKYSQIV